MKKYFLLVILVINLSCDTIFQEEYDNYIVIDSEQEKIDMINGIYANLVKAYNQDYFEALCRSDDINLYLNYSFSKNGSGCSFQRTYDYTPKYDNIYFRFYKIIISANSVLPQLSEETEPGLVGEFYMLRAYAYFNLARFFGNPHLVKDIDVNYLLKRPTYTEVYEFIEEDMLNALRLLPDTWSMARIPGETPHKGTAKALLAEIYLAWAGYPINDKSRYNKAAQFADDVIQNHEYYGFGLLDDFADLWIVENKHNKENIFGLFFNSKDYETRNRITHVEGYDDEYSPDILLLSTYKPELKFYSTFPDNYRKKSSFITERNFSFPRWTPDSTYYDNYHRVIDPIEYPCNFLMYAAPIKFVDTIDLKNLGEPTSYIPRGSEITLYLLRYAQTLLTYAEAHARSGMVDDSAYEAVNMIRRRANKLDPGTPSLYDLQKNLSPEQFLDSLVWERAWELCFEPNGRWFDIVRLDLKDKLHEYRFDFDFPYETPPEFLEDNWYFYVLP